MISAKALEDDVVCWLEKAGYRSPTGAKLVSADVEQLCQGNMVDVWKFLMAKPLPWDSEQFLTEVPEQPDVQEPAVTTAARMDAGASVEERLQTISLCMADAEERLREGIGDVCKEESSACAAQRHADALAFRLMTLEAWATRRQHLLEKLDEQVSRLRSKLLTAAAPFLTDAGDAPRVVETSQDDDDEEVARLLRRGVDDLYSKTVVSIWGDDGEGGVESLQDTSVPLRQPRPRVEYTPTEEAMANIYALLSHSPSALLRAFTAALEAAAQRARADATAEGEGGEERRRQGTEAASAEAEVDALLHQQRGQHIQRFLRTQACRNAAARMQAQLQKLREGGNVGGHRADPADPAVQQPGCHAGRGKEEEAAELEIRVAGARAAVAALSRRRQAAQEEAEARQAKQRLLQQRLQRIEDLRLGARGADALLQRLAAGNSSDSTLWAEQRSRVQALLQQQLLPKARSLTAAVQALGPCLADEQQAALQLPVDALPLQASSRALPIQAAGGCASNPLNASAAALCSAARPTGKGVSPAVQAAGTVAVAGDGGSAAALGRAMSCLAASSSPAAPLQRPSALLLRLAQLSGTAHRLQDHAVRAARSLKEAAAAADQAEADAQHLQHRTDEYRHRLQQRALPDLQAACEEGQRTLDQQLPEVKLALHDWWHQPALDALPWYRLDGRSALEWRQRIEAVHAELRGHRAAAAR